MKRHFFRLIQYCSILLAVLVLINSIVIVSSCEKSSSIHTIPSIYVRHTRYNPFFVQAVYLEPETEYVFSYLYKNLPAGDEACYYTDYSHSYQRGIRVYSDEQNMISRTFKTVSLSSDNVIVGSGCNSGLILSYIGIRMISAKGSIATDDSAYIDEKCIYGGFVLYKKDDKTKSNLFKDLSFSSIGYNASGAGIWTSFPAMNSNYAAINFARFDDDKVLSGFQDPDENVYAVFLSEQMLKLKRSGTDAYFVQTLWLKPNTNYIFSYYYSKAEASKVIAFKNDMSQEYVLSSPEYDTVWNRVSYEFTTLDSNDSQTEIGLNGSVKAIVGLQFTNSFLVGGYYGDLDLIEKNDESKTDLFLDSRYQSIGRKSEDYNWNGYFNSVNASETIDTISGVSETVFKRVVAIASESVSGGAVIPSKQVAKAGDMIDVTLKPLEGYHFKNGTLKVNENQIIQSQGGYRFECPGEDCILSAEFESNDTIPAVFIKRTDYASFFVQRVYLEPDTKYVFSYLYSNLPASAEALLYTDYNHEFNHESREYDSNSKRITKRFTTVASDTPGVIFGTDENASKIMSYIGIQTYKTDESEYLNGSSLYADFILYKADDFNKENLFRDSGFESIGGVWQNGYNSPVGLFYGRFDTDKTTPGAQNPKLELFQLNNSTDLNKYSITSVTNSLGFVNLSRQEKVAAGKVVIVRGVPKDNYRFDAICICESNNIFKSQNGISCFTMPNNDITITAIFKKIMTGDCNSDDIVNIKDVVRLKKYMSDDTTKIALENTDINLDGDIDSIDSVLLNKKLFGLVVDNEMMPFTGGSIQNELLGGADDEANIIKTKIKDSKENYVIKGTTYYISENGDDQNNGLSENFPIKTFDKLNTMVLNSGDAVLFERGSIFRLNNYYSCKQGVTYGAYGIGTMPSIYGSDCNYADKDLWKQTEQNIWKVNLKKVSAESADAGIIVFNQNQYVGTKQNNLKSLIKNGYFYYSPSEQSVYLYFDNGNPGEYYKDIEIGRRSGIFMLSDDVNIDHLCFKYTGGHAIRGGGNSNINITNCEIGWIGGSTHLDTRFGNGIQFFNGCRNIQIANCWIYQVFDAGITFQGDDETAIYSNFTVSNNLIEYCSWSFEWWSGYEKEWYYSSHLCDIGMIENVCIDLNVMRFEGFGWAGKTRSPTTIHASWNTRTYKNLSNFTVKNNIFDCPNGPFITWKQAQHPIDPQDGYYMYGNTYYKSENAESGVFIYGTESLIKAVNQDQLEQSVKHVEPNYLKAQWIIKK